MADAPDSKSGGVYAPWGFESPPRHHSFQKCTINFVSVFFCLSEYYLYTNYTKKSLPCF